MTSTISTGDYRGAPADSIQYHYDIGNEFYELWLDPSRTYSCALWEDGDSLHSAQLRKLDYLIGQARAAGAGRVLDIGCGWGSLLRRLTEQHGVRQAVGLTLSTAQADAIRPELPASCEVRLENWFDHRPDTPYDAIISIGAFEHFARYGMPRPERVTGYRQFFRRCRDWLPPGGRLAVQTIAKGNNVRLDRRTIDDLRFVIELVFPDSELPWFSEVLEASEKLFECVAVRNDAEHYARTCTAWHEGLVANREHAVRLVGEENVQRYERYLQVLAYQFEAHHLSLLRFTFERM